MMKWKQEHLWLRGLNENAPVNHLNLNNKRKIFVLRNLRTSNYSMAALALVVHAVLSVMSTEISTFRRHCLDLSLLL